MTTIKRDARLWIFDLDGTLTDSFPAYRQDIEEIFQSRGFTFTDELLRELLGSNPLQYFKKHLGEDKAPVAFDELNRRSIESATRVRAFEGIADGLGELEKRGEKMAVWTARDRASADVVLQASGLHRFFGHWVSSCCVSRTKPFPDGALRILKHFDDHDPAHAFMVGDHDHDMQGARAAGIPGVRVGWNKIFGHHKCDLSHKQFHEVSDFVRWAGSMG